MNRNQDGTRWQVDLKSLQDNWEEFARFDPMWAIITDPRRSRNRWNSDEFFESGKQEIAIVMDGVRTRGYQFGRQRALDFGCGVGRLTQALCQQFEGCYGVDISSAMVAHAKRFNRYGDRCQYVINQVDNLTQFESDYFDFIYTNIVLQHIEKKYNESYLREFIRLLRPNGLLGFQLPSSLKPDYLPPPSRVVSLRRIRRLVQRVLTRAGVGMDTLYRWGVAYIPAVMEMHCFEKGELETYITANGGTVREAERYDSAGPAFISYR